MNHQLSTSLIITTYNWPAALGVTLCSVLKQSRSPGEIIVADDGSDPETAKKIEEILRPSAMRWCHVRHDDSGLRQARIKNLAIKYSRGLYMIFVDHDVVLHPDFVADHLSMALNGFFLQGKRAFLPAYYTEKLLTDRFSAPVFPFIRGLENRKNAFRYPKLGRLLARPKNFQTPLRGCNLSMDKDDFLRVDGYDETFDQLWGREDSDICYRLFRSGVRVKNLWFSALQYHLHHKVIKKRQKDRLDHQLLQSRDEKRMKALKGFSQLSSEGEIVAASSGF
jgi:glycosyltransferase involved in cell wall biosynthesis